MSKKKREHKTFDRMVEKRNSMNFKHANTHGKGNNKVHRSISK